MESEVAEGPRSGRLRSGGSVTLASDALSDKDNHHSPPTGPPLGEDDHQASSGPLVNKKDDHPTSTGPALVKQNDHQPSTDPRLDKKDDHQPSTVGSSDFKQGKASDSTCVNQSAETKEKALTSSVARKIKQEPKDIKVKEEPIDLEDDNDIRSSRDDDDDDDDDCIIVLDVIRAVKKKRDKPKASFDEVVLISDSDDEDSVKGDEKPTSSQNLKPREKVGTEPAVDSSVSEDIQTDHVKAVTKPSTSSQNLKPKEKFGTKPTADSSVLEDIQVDQVKAVTDNSSHCLLKDPSTVVGSKDESNAIMDVSETVFPSSPASLDDPDKVSKDVTSNHLAWTEHNLKDNLPVPEPVMEDELTDTADVVPEQDGEAQDLEDGDIPFGDGYDSDGWEVDSEDESNKDAAKTDENSGKGRETEQIVERSATDLTTRHKNMDANPRPIQVTPVDTDLTTRQDNSLVPIGIIPIAAEMNTRLDDVEVPPLTTDEALCGHDVIESGKRTIVSPVKKENSALMEPVLADSDLKSMTQDDGHSHGLRSQSKQRKASVDENLRAAVTRSKLRSCGILLKEVNENKATIGKSVDNNLPDVVKGNSKFDHPVFNCHLCFHSFREKKLLEEHLVNHPEVTRIMCKYCNTSFGKQRNLNVHLKRCYSRKKRKSPRKTLHGDPRDSARIKSTKRDPPRRSEQHSPLTKERRKLDFSPKNEFPRTKAEGAHHKSPKQRDVKHECKICGKVCPTLRGLHVHHTLIHVLGKQGKKDDRNPNLKGNMEQKDANLKSSMKLKEDIAVWLCPKCHGSFTSRSKVKRHMYLTHSGTNAKDALEELKTMPKKEAARLIYYCATCKESFRSKYTFDRHKSTKKSRKRCEKLFQCNLCFKHFDKKGACAGHVQEHLRPVESRKRKRSSSVPTEQQSNHKRAKVCDDFKCRYCGKTFELKYLCAKHEFTHTDRDPWHCYICFKIFYFDSSIIAHMEKVHKEASYCKKCYCIMKSKDKKLCIDCDKKRVGSGLKCSICKTEFVNPSDLTHHILTHVESGVETLDVKVPKVSKVSLDPGFQNTPRISVTTHPPSTSQSTSRKTTLMDDFGLVTRLKKTPKQDCHYVTRSRSESLTLEASKTHPPSTSQSTSRKTTLMDDFGLVTRLKKTPKAPSRPKQVCHRVTRSQRESLTLEASKKKKGKLTQYEVCMKCGEQDISLAELSKHARTHLDVRSRYQCNTCQQCFVTVYEIEEHGCVPNHQASCSYTVSDVVYQCLFCGMDFQNMMEARKHVLSTNKSCLLECTECKAEYPRQGDLMVHMISVHGQYLECDKCSAQFTRQIDLDNHIGQHEDMSH